MAAPSQEYPPWLTPVPSVITDAAGVPIATSTTILFLPLTYYGPSIPLGPDWTYGGLTPPASTTTAIGTSATPTSSLTTTAIPTSSIPSSSSLSSSTSLLSTSATSSTGASSPTSTSASATPASAAGLSRGQLVGVIVASILGFIFLLVLLLALYLFCKGKNRRRSRATAPGTDDDGWVDVPPGIRVPGDGSPRPSGGEADPFLQPRGAAAGAGAVMSEKDAARPSQPGVGEMGIRAPAPPTPPQGVPRVPPLPTTSLSSSNSSSTNSGYGEVLAQPTLGFRPIPEEDNQRDLSGGRILTPEEMARLDEETVLPHEPDSDNGNGQTVPGYAYSTLPALLPPPRLVDPNLRSSTDFTLPRPRFMKRPSQTSNRSSFPADLEEGATLLTARRVKVDDLGPRTPPRSSPLAESPGTSRRPTSGGLLESMGLGGLAGWLKGSDSPRASGSRSSTQQHQPLLHTTPLSDDDLEQGRLALPPLPVQQQMREPGTSSSRGGLSIGLGPDGSRPISNVSGRSGNSGGTVYHDALSSLPATPSLTPLPRAMTPASGTVDAFPVSALPATRSLGQLQSQQGHAQAEQATLASTRDEHVQGHTATGSNTPAGTSYTQTLTPSFDILDMPAPPAVSDFSSSSVLLKQQNKEQENVIEQDIGADLDTSFSTITSNPPVPGLDVDYETIPVPKAWAAVSSGSPSANSGSSGAGQEGVGVGMGMPAISIDVLEEDPPAAGVNWREMAAAIAADHERRTTFGLPTYVQPPDYTSEQGSLHSMRSHLSPGSPRSTGSAAASRRENSGSIGTGNGSGMRSLDGSFSSNAASFAQSIARSGSITSDGRRRQAPISPALSAFGPQVRSTNVSREGSGSGSGSGSGGVEEGLLQSPGNVYVADTDGKSRPTSPLSMPWAAGLDSHWSPS